MTASVPAPPPPMRGWSLAFAALAINLGIFAEVLDMAIIHVAVPAIGGSLGASQSEATWAISAYAVAAAIVQPVTGWLTERYGEVHLFAASSALFTVVSVMCGFAPSMELLVFFRLLQGAAGGPLIPLSQTLMLKSFPSHQRHLAQSIWGATALAGPVFGPILGGWLTDSYSWRWAFFINVPVGVFTVGVVWTLMRHRNGATLRRPVDFMGALLLAAGIGSLQFMFDHGHEEDWFDSPMIVALASMAAVSLLLFAVWERYEPHPIVSLALFRRRNFVVPVAVIAIGYAVVYGVMVIFPLWLQSTLGYSATRAGVASASFGVSAIASAALLGLFGNRLPLRTTATAAMALFALGSASLALLPSNATFWQLSVPRIAHGIALPLFFFVLSDIMFTGVPPSVLASASSLASFVRTMLLSLSTALTVTIWDDRADIHHIVLSESVDPQRAAAMGDMAGNAFGTLMLDTGPTQALATLEQLVQLQSRTLAFNDVCWMGAAVFLLLIPVIWFAKPPFGGDGGMH